MKKIALLILCTGALQADRLENLFTGIYQRAVWGKNKDGLGTSGSGSTVASASKYMEIVQQFIKDNEIESVVDAGCGDWEFTQHMDWTGINYIGYDIVKFVIERNIQQFNAPNITFIHGNFVNIDLPKADLLLCKDVLQHLDTNHINTFKSQLRKFKYCLITDGPTVDMYKRLPEFNRKVIAVYQGDETKKIVLIDNSEQ